MLDQVEKLRTAARKALEAASDEEALEAWRIAYLGRKGSLTTVLRSLGELAPEERRSLGLAANRLKEELEAALSQRQAQLQEKKLAHRPESRLDVTLPGRPVALGRLHPITQTIREILAAFTSMGFQVMEAPEVESDYNNFEFLRIPPDHPARDMWDTLWIDYEKDGQRPMLLRTQTTAYQAHVMEQMRPPIRAVIAGKCYRHEATDATHEWMFYQIDGLAIDEDVTMADLKGTLYEFARRLFGRERRVRFRCDYFPFVEPGVDMAIDCFLCRGEGCRTCSGTGWIEIMGAGMVHPEILTNMGYDAERYTGFAAGIGVERIALLRHGIEDIRTFYANDLRFLEQF